MKKYFIILAVCLAAVLSSFIQGEPDIKIEVQNGALKFNGQEVTPGWQTGIVTGSITGKARVQQSSNKTHTYDQYGFIVFEKIKDEEGSGNINELQVYFVGAGDTYGIKPSQAFSGQFMIEGSEINANTDYAAIKSKLKSYKRGEGYTKHMYKFAKNNFYFYFLFDDNDKHIIKVSMGKDD